MNYYKRWMGDYAGKTAHLSLAEHGAYCKLLDWQYTNECALPDDDEEVYRLAGAMNPAERKAVDKVRQQFFRHEGWNARARMEIEKDRPRMEAAAQNGKRSRGRPRNVPHETPEIKPSGLIKEEINNPLGFKFNPSDNPQGSLPTPHSPIKDIPTSSGVATPPETPDPIFGFGLDLLKRKSVNEKAARSFLGMMRRDIGDTASFELLERCDRADITDPIPWLRKAMGNMKNAPPRIASEAAEAWQDVREANRSARWPSAWRHPKTAAALTAIGGRARLSDMQVNDAPFIQREFEQAYRSAV